MFIGDCSIIDKNLFYILMYLVRQMDGCDGWRPKSMHLWTYQSGSDQSDEEILVATGEV